MVKKISKAAETISVEKHKLQFDPGASVFQEISPLCTDQLVYHIMLSHVGFPIHRNDMSRSNYHFPPPPKNE